MDLLRDEIDILKHANEKAIHTEEHLKRLKVKLESLIDVSECLKREEKAHSETVDKCIRLESEIVVLQPLRRQLDDYKGRLVEVEIKLAEYEQDNKILRQTYDHLYHENAVLQRGTHQQKEEELLLRRQLEADHSEQLDDFPSIGVGLSELNPELKAELTRLRSENEQLKVFASKRDNDNVQQMEEKLEDLNLLSTQWKEKYLSTKLSLDESIDREKEFHQQLLDAISREEELKKELFVSHQQFELEKVALLKEAIDSRTKLENDLMNQLSSEKSRLQGQVDEAIREKIENDQKASSLLHDLQLKNEAEIEYLRLQHQQKIDEILKTNEDDRRSLIDKGKHLIKKKLSDHELKLKEVEMKLRDMEEQCEEKMDLMKKKMAHFENEAKSKLAASQKAYESCIDRHRVLEDKCEALDEECRSLKREKSNIENELDRQLGVDTGQGYLQYEHLQRVQSRFNAPTLNVRVYVGIRMLSHAHSRVHTPTAARCLE